jgi:hypothetical protein
MSEFDELRKDLLNAENRIIQSGMESWEYMEMNYGPHMYNLWLLSFEYLMTELGIESILMHPKSEGVVNFHTEHEMELPWLRLVALPEYRFPHMRIACRFEGRYKWNLFIDWVTKPYYIGFRGHYWLCASHREPELPENLDDGIETEENWIGGDFSIRADVEGWIDLVKQIISIERGK